MTQITAHADDAGQVRLPMVHLVPVAGKTTRNIQAQVKDGWMALLNNPRVTVERANAQNAPMHFPGAFNQPGMRWMNGATTSCRCSPVMYLVPSIEPGDRTAAMAQSQPACHCRAALGPRST